VSRDAALAAGRQAAVEGMTSRVDVYRKTDETTTDADGYEVPVWEPVHYDLPFRLVGGDTRAVTVGGVTFQEATARGDLPWDTTDLADGDYLDVISGEWAESVFRVVEAVKGDQRTARRVPVAEVPRPGEWG
jgi:hypothetical protein